MDKDEPCCYFHPDEVFVGVCPLCLYERLIVLTTKRCRLGLYRTVSCKYSKPRIVLPKMFALDSFIHRHHRKSRKHQLNDVASPPQDDSYISIRFDHNNTVGAWEKGEVSKVSLQHCNMKWNNHNKSVVEHAKPQWSSLRWRKRIGHIFQLSTWKKASKVNGRHVGSGKIDRGNQWIRNLARRKTSN